MESDDPDPSPFRPDEAILKLTPGQRGRLAAEAMGKALEAEHKMWDLPLLTWEDVKVVENPAGSE